MLSLPKADLKVGLAAALLLLVAWLGSVAAAAQVVLYRGQVEAFRLNVRSGPSQDAPVVTTLDRGVEVDVIGIEGGVGGWLSVAYQGMKGYVRNRPRYVRLLGTDGSEGQESLSASKAEKQVIDEKIQDETRRMADFSQKEVEILDSLNKIDYSLNQARVRAQALTTENQILEAEIKEMEMEIGQLVQAMAQAEAYAGERFSALYRMHMMGSLEMAGPPASLFDFFVKQRAMKAVVKADYALLSTQAETLARMGRLKSELEAQRKAKTALENELAVQIRIKEKESEKKAVILQEIQAQKRLSLAALASLQDAALALEQRLAALGLSGSAALDDTSFVKQMGQLKRPVSGKIISFFGPSKKAEHNAFTFQSGIDIRVERGEPVRSVFKGEVMFAQWLRGYGNIVIINHGDNYYTLYAHLEEIFKQKGETVETSEVIATAGDTGSIKGMCLHFEVRHHGKPVNPMKWLKQGA